MKGKIKVWQGRSRKWYGCIVLDKPCSLMKGDRYYVSKDGLTISLERERVSTDAVAYILCERLAVQLGIEH